MGAQKAGPRLSGPVILEVFRRVAGLNPAGTASVFLFGNATVARRPSGRKPAFPPAGRERPAGLRRQSLNEGRR